MKAFTLIQPRSLADALGELAANRDAKGAAPVRVLAGGQDLLTEMKEHLVEPQALVELKRVPGLDAIELDAQGGFKLGALATVTALEQHPELQKRLPLLVQAAATVASPQIRSQGTLGGNLCQRPRCWYYRLESAKCLKKGGSECFSYAGMNKYNAILGGGPSYIVHPSDLAPALVALEAEVVLRSAAGERRLKLEDFYTLPADGDITTETVLRPDELLTQVIVPPPPPGMKSVYLKFRERGSFDFALSAVAACVWSEGGRVKRARLVLGGVAPRPWRVPAAEKLLEGRALDAAALAAAGEAAVAGAEALGQNDYKIPLTKGLIARALGACA